MLAGIRAGGTRSSAFPQRLFKARSGCVLKRESVCDSSADRCGGSAGPEGPWRASSLLPVELRPVNHAASTNGSDFTCNYTQRRPTIICSMASPSPFDLIAERVERLLLRHAELRRTNALLSEQVATLAQERDALKSRLGAARARVDALLERLPENVPHKESE